MSNHSETNKSGFATAGLVLGIIGVCTSFIPIVNNLSFILALIGILFLKLPWTYKFIRYSSGRTTRSI